MKELFVSLSIFSLCLCAALFAVFIFIVPEDIENSYKQGQIDALTGKIKYHLVVKPDSTRAWEEITAPENVKVVK